MLVSFLMTWADQLMWASIASIVLTLAFWVTSHIAWMSKEIDYHEFQTVSIVCGTLTFLLLLMSCLPNPERVARVNLALNGAPTVEEPLVDTEVGVGTVRVSPTFFEMMLTDKVETN